MPPEFLDPTAEQQNVTLIDAVTLREAEKLIAACEYCQPDDADTTASDLCNSDAKRFVLCPARCLY